MQNQLQNKTWGVAQKVAPLERGGRLPPEAKFDAGGERVRKDGPNGETIYVNQFYSLSDDLIASAHIYAGNTRIATRVKSVGKRLDNIAAPVKEAPRTVNDILGSDTIKFTGKGKELTKNATPTNTQTSNTPPGLSPGKKRQAFLAH